MLHLAENRKRFRILWLVLLMAVSPWAAVGAHAAEDCAGTPQAVIQYLNKAETQTEDYKIKVLAGTYLLTGQKSQWIATASITVEGGYIDCNTRGVVSASATVLDATGLPGGIGVAVDGGDLKVDGLTMKGGSSGTALSAGGFSSGSLTITHSRITQTNPFLGATNGSLSLDEVLIDHTPADANTHCSAYINLTENAAMEAKFVTVQTGNADDLCVRAYRGADLQATGKFHNSIVWPGGIKMSADAWHSGDVFNLEFHNTLFNQVIVIDGVYSEDDSVHADPLWTNPAAGDFTLQSPPSPISPAINVGAGAAEVPGGISDADTDIAGNHRLVGSAPDMGAYESSVDDGALFAVTTTDDCSTPLNQPSCGSLRDAIARATAPTSTAAVKTIKFWIIDWMNQPICPAVINIGSSLPDITKNVVIDGFSQGSINEIDPPLSWPNMDPYIFSASLCLNIVGPGSGVAFRVPAGSNGSLTLRGVGLGGFQQGVMLLGGGNHQIAGNQFGGVTSNGVDLGGFSIQAVNMSPANQPSGALIIGGDNVADRNVFLNAFSFGASAAKAIFIGPGTISDPSLCQIDGNLIGIQPDGMSATGNDYGLVLTGDGCTVRNNWVAGSHKGAIWVQGQHYIVQSNVLGLAPRSFAQQNNGGFGIRINGSSNTVGAPASDFVQPTPFVRGLGNYIEDMLGNGIAIAAPAVGNTIRGNWVINSGIGAGVLAVDLGEDGPTANDNADSDAGPNNLQNFPQPHGLSWTAPPQPGATNAASVRVTLMTPPGPGMYNLDIYLGDGCDPAGRGLPLLWVGSYPASVAPAATTSVFDIPVGIPDYYDPSLAAVSLMATSLADGSTSEIGSCLSIDVLFKDGFD